MNVLVFISLGEEMGRKWETKWFGDKGYENLPRTVLQIRMVYDIWNASGNQHSGNVNVSQ